MLKGFGVSGFRSFGPEPQYLYPLEKMNLIVGRNNSGKSNVLRAVRLLEKFFGAPKGGLNDLLGRLDAHDGSRPAEFAFHFPLVANEKESIHTNLNHRVSPARRSERQDEIIKEILVALSGSQDGVVWQTYKPWSEEKLIPAEYLSAISNFSREYAFKSMMLSLIPVGLANYDEELAAVSLRDFLKSMATPSIPAVQEVSAHRRIGEPGSSCSDLNGSGLIRRLLELSNPKHAVRKANREKFDKLNNHRLKPVGLYCGLKVRIRVD